MRAGCSTAVLSATGQPRRGEAAGPTPNAFGVDSSSVVKSCIIQFGSSTIVIMGQYELFGDCLCGTGLLASGRDMVFGAI